MALDAQFLFRLTANLTSALDLTTVSAPINLSQATNFTNGAGANQVDRVWSDNVTVTASSTQAIDLAGSLTDPFGASLTFVRIKAVFVRAAAGNTNNVNVVRDATNGVALFLATGDGIPVKPGGMFAWIDPTAGGVAVTAGTGDLLNIVNSGAGTSVSCDVVILGSST
jgi:hypothetical protein